MGTCLCIKLADKQPGHPGGRAFLTVFLRGQCMTDSSAFGFGQFIPGFDFLQNLGKAGQSTGGMPPFAHWVAPTVSVEEIEKRIEELKAVQFWLEQNGRALAATVQALEVQKMTLSTLQGMNVNLADIGKAFPLAASAAAAAASQLSDWPMSTAEPPTAPSSRKAEGAAPPQTDPFKADEAPAAASAHTESQVGAHASMGQAMQWWGALTQQFQHIAQQAMQDPSQQQALLKASQMGSELAQKAVQTASDMVRQAVAKAPSQSAQKADPKTKPQPASAQSVPAQKTATKPAAAGRAPAKKSTAAAKMPAAAKKSVAAPKAKGVTAQKTNAIKSKIR